MSAADDAPSPGRHTIHAVRPEKAERGRTGEPGMVLGGKYRLERPIARGGMAAVWSATHITLNRPVAVKFIDALQGADADEHVGRFLREAKVAASVRHKNVVDILDFGVHETSDGVSEPYMIMELLEGEALDARLERGPMELDEVLGVVRQVLSGLDAVHARGIVHRDLKPGNVFLTDDQDGVFVRVLDFGISQGSEDKPTAERVVIGTPEYMSPEQAYGEPLDKRSDVYSVGVMMYEMLTGRLPFEDPDPMTVINLVTEGNCKAIGDLRPDVPDLCAVVERAMKRGREDRYETAREMQRAVMGAVGLEVTGRFAAVTRRGSGEYSREATTLELEPEAGAGSTRKPSHRSIRPGATVEEALDAEVEQSKRWKQLAGGLGVVLLLALLGVSAWAMTRDETPVAIAPAQVAPPPTTVALVATPAPAPAIIIASPVEAVVPAVPEESPGSVVIAPPPRHSHGRMRATATTPGAPPITAEPHREIERELDF